MKIIDRIDAADAVNIIVNQYLNNYNHKIHNDVLHHFIGSNWK